ncbi:MAG: glycosyltransferase family 4 protein [Drouetiella hepatica Uher 2000/2452]|jgi:glycosyltransferase involved in cell wall biosynthesis|uniref:Glycosyltransferase family 4 protein n=1 Tax=Drouetiella hepatica Uher 2000/2452 TaxID=904376 RepID=A0A951QEW8_9CYAN|nr:glycosyltransferase family 4 protein [Drouetiella hepatica Uher 2000/2452]
MLKHYIFFTRNTLPQPRADLVQVANCANAAANLGYSSVLTYLKQQPNWLNLGDWVEPFKPQFPEENLSSFYNLQDKLKVAALPIPWTLARSPLKGFDPSTIASKYYLPLYMRSRTQIVHTRDWNFVKAAIQNSIPVIYEHHHHESKQFEPEIVNHSLFQIAVTVADTVRETMIESGMPPQKVVKIHNGFNQLFLQRQPEQAKAWRQKLLSSDRSKLAVYSGALHPFKGVDLLIEVAKALPDVQFVFAGGDEAQVAAYRTLCQQQQVFNAKFLGYVLHQDLASLLQAADVLVHPHCLGKAATFTSPLKFFDYMASGTPIVSTEIPSLMEFKLAGVVAGWCEADRAIALAATLQRVLESHPRRSEGYSDSMAFVQQFSWENRIIKILSHVKDSLKPTFHHD